MSGQKLRYVPVIVDPENESPCDLDISSRSARYDIIVIYIYVYNMCIRHIWCIYMTYKKSMLRIYDIYGVNLILWYQLVRDLVKT